MAFISGPREWCTKCSGTRLEPVCESYDAIDDVYVGTVRCLECDASLLYSRRADQVVPTVREVQPALPFEEEPPHGET